MASSIGQRFDTFGLIKFTIPSVIMMVFISVYSMMGSVFASRFIGEHALAAINIVFPFISFALAVSIMFATGANAIISLNLGSNDLKKARENFTVITILSFSMGLVFMLIGLVFDDQIIRVLGATEAIIPYAKTYLRIYSFIFPFLFLDILSQYFFVTEGKAFMGMLIVVIGGLLNMLVAYLLLAVFRIGIGGVAMGSAIAYSLPAIIYLIYFLKKKDRILYFVKPKLHRGFILNACLNGSSEMVTNLAIATVAAVMNIIMGNLVGDNGIAAVAVIIQVQFLLSSMYIGFGAGIAPIFGFAHGADDRLQIKTVFGISVKLVLISSIILVILCMIFNKLIVAAFIDPLSPSFGLANSGFILFAMAYLFVGFNIYASVFFTSVSNGKVSALISFLRTFLFILGMLAILPPILGTKGVWLAIPIAELLAIIISLILLKRYRKVYHY